MTELPAGVSVGRAEVGGAERFQRLGRQLGTASLGLNVVVLRPGERMRVHRHQRQEEIYVVLEGILTIEFEETHLSLSVHDAARVAPDVRRQLTNPGEGPCAVLAVGAAGEHDTRDAEAFHSWSDRVPRQPRDVPLPPNFDR